MVTRTLSVILLFCFYGVTGLAAEKPIIQIENEKINYSTGYQLGSDFKRQGLKFSPKLLVRGVLDASAGSQSLMTPQDMRTALMELQQQVAMLKQEKASEIARNNQLKDKQFLADNAKKYGVIKLPSGLQYRVIKPGTGKQPQETDSVTLNYRGTLLDGTEFDNSSRRNKAATFKVDGVIRGCLDPLQTPNPPGGLAAFRSLILSFIGGWGGSVEPIYNDLLATTACP